MITRVDHIGIAVRNLEETLGVYDKLFNLKPSRRLTSAQHGVNIAFLPVGDTQIELLESLNPESRVGKFLESKGEGIYHICLEVSDIDQELKAIESQGGDLIDKQAWKGSLGMKVAFIGPRSTHGVMIELVQKES